MLGPCHLQPWPLTAYLFRASPCSASQPVYVPLQIELSGAAVPALSDGQHVGSVLRPVASVSKVRLALGLNWAAAEVDRGVMTSTAHVQLGGAGA